MFSLHATGEIAQPWVDKGEFRVRYSETGEIVTDMSVGMVRVRDEREIVERAARVSHYWHHSFHLGQPPCIAAVTAGRDHAFCSFFHSKLYLILLSSNGW